MNVIVVGSGVAGMACAHRLSVLFGPDEVDIRILSKEPPEASNSFAAQGGVAVAVEPSDSWQRHRDDTLVVGAGRCDPGVVEMVVREGPGCIRELRALGAIFDTDAHGQLDVAKEGGHSAARVVHQGDRTGVELVRVLRDGVARSGSIRVEGPSQVLDLLVEGAGDRRRCCGVRVLDLEAGLVLDRYADVVVLATGGAGQVYATTTNPVGATGSGIAMAERAGVPVRDMAFVQFHPTALYDPGTDPAILITEAVRGAGARLRSYDGRPLMDGVHPMTDLAPRNVVARTVHKAIVADGAPHVWLDASMLSEELFVRKFPSVHAHCLATGVDPTRSWIPVIPAAHYLCGGVRTDRFGRTGLTGLYALGECASSGLHGADRLASNSLLEALVIPRKAAANILVTAWPHRSGVDEVVRRAVVPQEGLDMALLTARLRKAMTWNVGILRDRKGLAVTERLIEEISGHVDRAWRKEEWSNDLVDLRDLVTVARSICGAAQAETRNSGTHYNEDLATLAAGRLAQDLMTR